jgi:transposase
VVAHSRSHSIDLSVAGRRAGWTPGAAPCAASCLAEPLFVGLDVSKSWVDSADSAGRKQRVSNDAAALTAALEGYRGVCANMVCEATGGCERALLQVAAERAPPLRRVHPNRAHAFAKATGQLGKTDALDAQRLKTFAAFTAGEPPAPCRVPTQTLAAMVSRLNQLTDLRQSESCRAQQAEAGPIRGRHRGAHERHPSANRRHAAGHRRLHRPRPRPGRKRQPHALLQRRRAKTAQAVLAWLPEIGTLNRRKIAALVGVAPIPCKSGSSIHPAAIARGRKPLRDILFMAALIRKRPQSDIHRLPPKTQSQRQAP